MRKSYIGDVGQTIHCAILQWVYKAIPMLFGILKAFLFALFSVCTIFFYEMNPDRKVSLGREIIMSLHLTFKRKHVEL